MASQLSPFVEANYGWPFGSSGWNDGMDQNLVKFSYLHDRNIDAIVSSLPAISNGSAYFNTSDNRLYFDVNGQRYSSSTPKWFEVTLRTTGQTYLFDGTTLSLTQRVSYIRASALDLGLTTGDCVANLQGLVPRNGVEFIANGFYPGSDQGGGRFVFDSTRPKSEHNGGTIISPTVAWARTSADISTFLNATGETDPSGLGCWVRSHGYDVFVSWFGAVGDAQRPSSAVPDAPILGTDDTLAIGKCRDYMQTIAFQPNLFVGFNGGFRLNFEPNKTYKVVGHNPLGSSRPRDDGGGSPGSLARQNWFIEGNAARIMWQVTAEDDCFIETHETVTRFWGRNLTVYGCNIVGAQGVFFSNVANAARNALAIPRFERFEVYHVQPSDPVNGFKRMFQFFGTNLGDRLNTNGCSFNQFHNFFYSENPESVGQAFASTSITSYITNATFFHLRTHGSGFNFSSGCNILMKATGQTLFRTEYLPGAETGVNGSSTYMDLGGCRLEGLGDALQTIANLDFGVLEISGITMTKGGGIPSIDSNAFIARKGAAIRVKNSNVYGRVIVGIPNTSTLRIRRSYAIKFEDCSFIGDVTQLLYVEDSVGALIPWRTAVVGAYQVPAVVIEGTDARTIGFDGLPTDTKSYVFDGLYQCNAEFNTIPSTSKLVVGRYRTSTQRFYLDNLGYVVLPPYITITSIKITHAAIAAATMDTLRVKVGSAQFDYALPNNTARRQFEILPAGQVVIISDNTAVERQIATECRVAGGVWATPSFISFVEIEWRPAYGLNEITTTESAGVRLTRLA